MQLEALAYLAHRFEVGRRYREPEVNDRLKAAHLFDDHALLRRELFELGYLARLRDGSEYWVPEPSKGEPVTP